MARIFSWRSRGHFFFEIETPLFSSPPRGDVCSCLGLILMFCFSFAVNAGGFCLTQGAAAAAAQRQAASGSALGQGYGFLLPAFNVPNGIEPLLCEHACARVIEACEAIRPRALLFCSRVQIVLRVVFGFYYLHRRERDLLAFFLLFSRPTNSLLTIKPQTSLLTQQASTSTRCSTAPRRSARRRRAASET